MVDLDVVPLCAVSLGARLTVARLLNPQKVLLTENGRFRDWRGLAGALGIGANLLGTLVESTDPTGRIFEFVGEKIRVGEFLKALEDIDRWDIVEDCREEAERCGVEYLRRRDEGVGDVRDEEKRVLTVDDLYRHGVGLQTQNYDAFLLYADEDATFANQLIEHLEGRAKLRLCTRDRDLVALSFEHRAIMQLISERCDRLIVLLTPNFIRSSMNEFFVNYAQAVGIHRQQRKIIPILYEKCEIPEQLHYTFILDYHRVGDAIFWRRLESSIRPRSPRELRRAERNALEAQKLLEKSPERSNSRKNSPESLKKSPELEKSIGKSSELQTSELSCVNSPKTAGKNDETFVNSTKNSEDEKGAQPTKKAGSLNSKLQTPRKIRFFPFSPGKSKDKSNTEDVEVKLPSLDGLDKLDDEGDNLAVKERKRGIANYKKRIRALVGRS